MTNQQVVKAPRGSEQVWATMSLRHAGHITDVDSKGKKLLSRPRDANEPVEEQWLINVFYEWDNPILQHPTDRHYINKSVLTPKPGDYSVLLTCGNLRGSNKTGNYDNDYSYNIIEWGNFTPAADDEGASTQQAHQTPQRTPAPPSNIEGRPDAQNVPRAQQQDAKQELISYLAVEKNSTAFYSAQPLMDEIMRACLPPDNVEGQERIDMFFMNLEYAEQKYAESISRLSDTFLGILKSKNFLP